MEEKLIALNVLFALKSTEITANTTKIKLAVVGEWRGHQTGFFKITQEDLEMIKKNFDAAAVDIVVDYEHMTLWGDKAPAAGWIKSMEVLEGELWANIEWLEGARDEIKKGEYKYISPVLREKTIDQVTGDDIGWTLHSAALTNTPFLEELGEVKANSKSKGGGTEDPNPTQKEKEEMAEENEELKTLQDENASLKEKLKEHKDAAAVAKVDGAIAAKKLDPKQKDAALKMCKADPEGFDALLEGAKTMRDVPGDNLFENSREHGTDKNNPGNTQKTAQNF